jgi:hypothetical protein
MTFSVPEFIGRSPDSEIILVEPSTQDDFWFVTKISSGIAEGLARPIHRLGLNAVLGALQIEPKECRWSTKLCSPKSKSAFLAEQREVTAPEPYVYFIQGAGLIKIGVSLYPQERLEALCLWSPVPLKLLAIVPGGYKLETKLHKMFAAFRVHGEWFYPTRDLIAIIEEYMA